ncbi:MULTISPECIES: glycerol kinase GlpK [Citromicrobium]|uniref:glycerol kinase GlpK n=1 Tax=Citromicrobium TaxID=72173 RepID=UPI0001DD0D9A|nr:MULTISPECIES: glycerol kinase GlpK [Citromicrobium]ALG60579.1 glycerol kinase [Citromicrobium sp. JL477]KPM14514.1 glycerol kinase [Citromicrobium sp. JL1351]KPM19814.1 glycerol kinase [Citromicrobium sp. JL31]KPM22770.1 glycerol kinase [Citromicrobium sp. JL2201]
MSEHILVIDAGTTSTRAILFGRDGAVAGTAQAEITQHFPQPGRVEHDAQEIWQASLNCARRVLGNRPPESIAAIGITNQRETVVAWDRETLKPLARAIVWQDRRTADVCRRLRDEGREEPVHKKTGLLLDPYFSATKMRWMLDNVDAVAQAQEAGRLAFGTVESWLVAKLSGGAHVSDASNASRTLLLPLGEAGFSPDLCDLFGVPHEALPQVVDTHGEIARTDPELFGRAIPICGLVGDQQAATIGQGCLSEGEIKATYGTGAFILANHGTQIPHSEHRLLSTVLTQNDGQRTYAIEGSVFVAGSLIQWLRDSLGLIDSAQETEALARSVENSGEVVIVPALAGLGAPHWRAEARGLIAGLSFSTGKAHIVRAALESMSCQTYDLATAFAADGARWESLRIDGGMSANDWLAQDIADILNIAVERPRFVETTALGAAVAAATGAGWFADLQGAVEAMRGPIDRFEPEMDEGVRKERLERWAQALANA